MTPSLDAALAECDELGVSLWVSDGKLSFRAGEFGIPDLLRETLRTHRNELVALLGNDQRPVPDWVPFIARNVDVRWFEFGLVKTVAVVLVNERPYYRLTPSIWVRLCSAVDNRAASILGDPVASDEVHDAAELLVSLGRWVGCYYRHDQIRRAWNNPHPLPPLPRCPGLRHDEPESVHSKHVSPRCPISPRSSGCGRSPSGPTADRPPTDAATIATGSDCVPWC